MPISKRFSAPMHRCPACQRSLVWHGLKPKTPRPSGQSNQPDEVCPFCDTCLRRHGMPGWLLPVLVIFANKAAEHVLLRLHFQAGSWQYLAGCLLASVAALAIGLYLQRYELRATTTPGEMTLHD